MTRPDQWRLANSSLGEIVKLVEQPEPDEEAERRELIAAISAAKDDDTELITDEQSESGSERE